MFALYVKDDDEMYLMDGRQVWEFLNDKTSLFENYSVTTDGNTVKIYEPSMGANGKVAELSLDEFYRDFEEEGYMIRSIQEIK